MGYATLGIPLWLITFQAMGERFNNAAKSCMKAAGRKLGFRCDKVKITAGRYCVGKLNNCLVWANRSALPFQVTTPHLTWLKQLRANRLSARWSAPEPLLIGVFLIGEARLSCQRPKFNLFLFAGLFQDFASLPGSGRHFKLPVDDRLWNGDVCQVREVALRRQCLLQRGDINNHW